MDFSWTSFKILFSFLGGSVVALLGGYDSILKALLYFIVIDFITGVLKALYEKKLDPDKIFVGVMRKMVILIIVSVAFRLELTFGDVIPIRETVILFYIVQEFLSIIKNSVVFTPIPNELLNYFDKKKGGK